MHPTKKLGIISTIYTLAMPLMTQAAYGPKETGLEATGSAAGISTAKDQLPLFIGTVIRAALGLVGVAFLLLMVYAGFLWMTSHGDKEMVEKSKDTLKRAVVGLIIVVGAYAITSFVITAFSKTPAS